MSPIQIECMLHHYYTSVRWAKSGQAFVLQELVEADLLYPRQTAPEGDSPYAISNRGRAYVHMLLCAPLPEPAWINPATGGVIDAPNVCSME